MSRKYDSTVARIAGNIMSGVVSRYPFANVTEADVKSSVALARAIVAETKRTEPAPPVCQRCKGSGTLWVQGDQLSCPDCGGVR